MRKRVLCQMRTTKTQISLRIRGLISVFAVRYLDSILPSSFYIQNFRPLASLCNRAGWFESYLVANYRRHIFVLRGPMILQQVSQSLAYHFAHLTLWVSN